MPDPFPIYVCTLSYSRAYTDWTAKAVGEPCSECGCTNWDLMLIPTQDYFEKNNGIYFGKSQRGEIVGFTYGTNYFECIELQEGGLTCGNIVCRTDEEIDALDIDNDPLSRRIS